MRSALSQLTSTARRAAVLALGLGLVACMAPGATTRPSSDTGTGPGPVARFSRGDFLESVAVAADGTLFINAMRPNGDTQLVRLKPGQAPEVFATLPNVGGVALAADGTPYVSVTSFGNKGNKPGVWKVDPSTGKLSRVVDLPQGAFPNGLTFDLAGNLFIADSALSTLWRIAPGASEAEPWLQHDMLAPLPQLQGIPGANGVKFFKGALYVSNSARGTLVRVPVEAGGKAGQPALHAQVEGPDDFAVDEQGGLYITQHLRNALVYVPPSGGAVSRTVADTQQGLWGPTAAAFGRTPGDETYLYVVTDGDWYQSVLSGKQDALKDSLVVRLNAGARGLAQP